MSINYDLMRTVAERYCSSYLKDLLTSNCKIFTVNINTGNVNNDSIENVFKGLLKRNYFREMPKIKLNSTPLSITPYSDNELICQLNCESITKRHHINMSAAILMKFVMENGLLKIAEISKPSTTKSFDVKLETDRNKGNLEIVIPETFKTVYTQSDPSNHCVKEYVLKNDNTIDWHELIRIEKKELEKNIPVKNYVQRFKSHLLANTQNYELIIERFSLLGSGEHAEVLVEYTFNNQREISGVSYYSNHHGSVGIQYTIRLQKEGPILSKSEIKKNAIEKIENFFLTHIKFSIF